MRLPWIVSISGRTTGDVHAVVNCYAPTIIQTYDTPSFPVYMLTGSRKVNIMRKLK